MLEKIIHVSNVGRFAKVDNQKIAKFTIVYAENGCGKSTLSALLRSLSSDNPDIVLERKALGSKSQPSIKLLFNSKDVIAFESGKWTAACPQIEVFDDIFVSENIFEGNTISSEHRSGLYEYAIGSLAVTLRQTEQSLDKEISDLNIQRQQAKKNIERLGVKDADQFVTIPRVERIDDIIVGLEREETRLRAADAIRNGRELSSLAPLNIDLDAIVLLLGKTIQDISRNAEGIIREHIRVHLQGASSAETWIEDGVGYAVGDLCPFCGQEMSGSSLLGSYSDYFESTYRALKTEISVALKSLRGNKSPDPTVAMMRVLSANDQIERSWAQYGDIRMPTLDLSAIEGISSFILEPLQQLLEEKQRAPLEPLNHRANDVLNAMRALDAVVLGYNEAVSIFNSEVQVIRDQTDKGSLDDIQAKLTSARLTLKRFTSASDVCDEYVSLTNLRAQKQESRDRTKRDLDIENDAFAKKYHEAINHYLQRFGVDFALTTDVDRRGGGKPRLMLSITLNEETVSISADGQRGKHGFKNTLSTGDKRSLALAFYFARLGSMDENQRRNAIVVLDDPIDSFGLRRRERTIAEIVRISQEVRQVVVLSHDPQFLSDLDKQMRILKAQPLHLQIVMSGPSSVVLDWQMSDTVKSRFVRKYESLVDFVNFGAKGDVSKLETIRMNLRIVLECTLQNRYPLVMPDSETLGKYIAILKKADSTTRYYGLAQNVESMRILEEVNEYSTDEHHGAGSSRPTDASELKQYALEVLGFVSGN